MTSLLFAFTAAGAPGLTAQISPGEFGFAAFSLLSRTGTTCSGFSCTPRPLEVAVGDTITLQVIAPHNALHVVLFSAPTYGCQAILGVTNSLILHPGSLLTGIVGPVSQPNAALFCHNGIVKHQINVPAVLPPGTRWGMQAVAVVPRLFGSGLAFSVAIDATIQ